MQTLSAGRSDGQDVLGGESSVLNPSLETAMSAALQSLAQETSGVSSFRAAAPLPMDLTPMLAASSRNSIAPGQQVNGQQTSSDAARAATDAQAPTAAPNGNSASRQYIPRFTLLDGDTSIIEGAIEETNAQTLGEIDTESLQQFLTKLRRMYTNSMLSGQHDRIGFETILGDLEQFFLDTEGVFSQQLDVLKNELSLSRKEREQKLREWIERYERLQYRWNECMSQISSLQEEKEDLRQQRDMLLMTHKAKGLMLGEVAAQDTKVAQFNFFKQLMENLCRSISDSLLADRGSIFIYHHPTKELRSLCLVSTSEDKLPKEIRLNCRKGIVGRSFMAGEALNIANAYQDNRFYRSIDKETGYVTHSVLCYPLYSPNDACIGVMQLINKKSDENCFTVEDEARMSEYSFILSCMLESAKDMFQIGMGNVIVQHEKSHDSEEASGTISMKRKASHLNITRIGHVEHMRDGRIVAGTTKPSGLVPKDIEEYIKKLEQCWRNAVKDCAMLQNVKAQLEQEKSNAQNRIFSLEKAVLDLEEKLKAFRDKSYRLSREHKVHHDSDHNIRDSIQEYHKLKDDIERRRAELVSSSYSSRPPTAPQASSVLGSPRAQAQSAATDRSAVAGSHQPQPPSTARNTGSPPSSVQLPYLDEIKRMRLELDLAKPVSMGEPRPTIAGAPEGVLFTPRDNGVAANRSSQIRYRDVFLEVFASAPSAMCILNDKYRIWRVNSRMCELLDSSEEELVGLLLSEICIIDQDTLPRLLQFDIVQGLGLHPPAKSMRNMKTPRADGSQKHMPHPPTDSAFSMTVNTIQTATSESVVLKAHAKPFVKANVNIGTIGDNGMKFSAKSSNKPLKAPLYVLLFTKVS